MMTSAIEWLPYWLNAGISVFNLSLYCAFHHWYSLPLAAFSGFVAIACKPGPRIETTF